MEQTDVVVYSWQVADVQRSIAHLRIEAGKLRERGGVHNLIEAEKAEAMADARDLTLQQLGLV